MLRRAFPVDISETDDMYILEAELPGVSTEQLEVKVSHEYIEISVDLRDGEEEKLKYLLQERPMGQFSRRINFNKPIESSGSKLSLKNGIMRIELPYAPEAKTVKLAIS